MILLPNLKNNKHWIAPITSDVTIAVATDASRSSPVLPATNEVEVFNNGSLYNLAIENCALIAIPIKNI